MGPADKMKEEKMNTIAITRSRSGIPCLFERGGGYTNIGAAQIIIDHICYDAVEAAVKKSYDYHCRCPYYIRGL